MRQLPVECTVHRVWWNPKKQQFMSIDVKVSIDVDALVDARLSKMLASRGKRTRIAYGAVAMEVLP